MTLEGKVMQTSTVTTNKSHFSGTETKIVSAVDAATTPSSYEALVDIDPDKLTSLTRIEDRLVLLFKDGSQLTVENFFLFEERYQSCLDKMSRDGDIWPALSEDEGSSKEVKYNFSQPATAWAFGGSVILMGAAVSLLW